MIKGGVGDYVKLQHKGKMKKEIIRIAAAIICAVVLITGSTAMNVKAENDPIIEINDLHIGDVVKAGVGLMYGDHSQGSTFCAVYYDGIKEAGGGTNITDSSNITYYEGYLVRENTKSSQGWWVKQIEEKRITWGGDSGPVAMFTLFPPTLQLQSPHLTQQQHPMSTAMSGSPFVRRQQQKTARWTTCAHAVT